MREQEHDQGIEEITEEGHVSEVAQEQTVDVASVQTVHRECEVVHEAEHIGAWPNQVHSIDECVQANDRITYVAIW